MFSSIKAATLAVIAVAIGHALAESHTVTFSNRCGHGTPKLIGQHGAVLSSGGAHTSHGPLIGAIAYLQTGNCGFNGEGCTLVETTLKNPTTPGSGSSTDISPHSSPTHSRLPPASSKPQLHLVIDSPHILPVVMLVLALQLALTVSSFHYFLLFKFFNHSVGKNAKCKTAFHKSTDTGVQVACQADNANLVVRISFSCCFPALMFVQITFCH
ncbi:Glycopeptide [Mycena sanguinolenta]|uniref:Glycopeptide n=1 Tax=Mycena sanguinolenta TaxID=230812 RepID=A0A8H6YX63_9AGAR|nr:Glycopeptide [Mycena sanguinolenta]